MVEDDDDLGQGIRELLDALGHEAVIATNGPRALHLVETFRPDVLLVDIVLPVFDGNLVAAAIRNRGVPAPRLIAMTGRKHSVLSHLFDDLLSKPLVPEDLIRALGTGAPKD